MFLVHCFPKSGTKVQITVTLTWGGGDRSGTIGGKSPDASFGFYLREAFQSQTNTEKTLCIKSH